MTKISLTLATALSIVVSSVAVAQNSPQPSRAQAKWSLPPDNEIHSILADRIDRAKQSVGMVVGIVDPKGKRIISYGKLNQNDSRPLDGDTVFEIGSVTKVFTSLLLSDMVERGEVSLNDPVAKYLSATVRVPERAGRKITLVDLATHTSGLPPLPTNMTPKDSRNPYADYTIDQLYQFLNGFTLPRDIGEKYEYSNLGAGLLGHTLSLRENADYGALIKARITDPLDMKDTSVAISPAMGARLAAGHDARLGVVSGWDLATLAGAGALKSTTNDLLKLLAAELSYGNNPLSAAMAAQISVRRSTGPSLPALGTSTLDVALGWHVLTDPKGTAIWHNGGTGGYRSFVGFNAVTKTGVVVLSNAANDVTDDIGFHLLVGKPLRQVDTPKPAPTHVEISLDVKAKQAFVGQYQLAPGVAFSITLEGDQLFAQLTGQQKFPVFAESQKQVFYKVIEAQLTFDIGTDGKASGLILHQNGRDIPAKRIN